MSLLVVLQWRLSPPISSFTTLLPFPFSPFHFTFLPSSCSLFPLLSLPFLSLPPSPVRESSRRCKLPKSANALLTILIRGNMSGDNRFSSFLLPALMIYFLKHTMTAEHPILACYYSSLMPISSCRILYRLGPSPLAD